MAPKVHLDEIFAKFPLFCAGSPVYTHGMSFLAVTNLGFRRSQGGGKGFILLLCLVLVAVLCLLLVGLSTWLRVEYRIAGGLKFKALAENNAILGLEAAMAQLQEAAGPDQRITATAELAPLAPQDLRSKVTGGNVYWTGVWAADTATRAAGIAPDYGNRTQLAWLVSGTTPPYDYAPERKDSGKPKNDSDSILVGAGTMAESDARTRSVIVPKVAVSQLGRDGSEGVAGHYAFWVGDEGVKARLNLPLVEKENPTEWDTTFRQSLSAREGVEAMSGFAGSAAFLELIKDSDRMALIAGPFSLAAFVPQLTAGGNATATEEVVKDRFADISFFSKGLLTNVRKGGFRQDLTRVFEMDDAAFSNLPAFTTNSQKDVVNTKTANINIGYLYELPFNAPSGSALSPTQRLIRGPTWHLLKNTYRLYNRESEDDSSYYSAFGKPGTDAWLGRGLEPGPIDRPTNYSHSTSGLSGWVANKPGAFFKDPWSYPYQNWGGALFLNLPIKPSLAPVITHIYLVFSLQEVDGKLNVVMDVLGSMVNPYDVPLELDAYTIAFTFTGMWGFKLNVTDYESPPLGQLPSLHQLFDQNGFAVDSAHGGQQFEFVITSDGSKAPLERIRMSPGEVITFSAAGDNPENMGILPAKRGWNRMGGIRMSNLPYWNGTKVVWTGTTGMTLNEDSTASLELPQKLDRSASARITSGIPVAGNLGRAFANAQPGLSTRESQEMVFLSKGEGLWAIFGSARLFTKGELADKRPTGVLEIRAKTVDEASSNQPAPLADINNLRAIVHVPLNCGAQDTFRLIGTSPSFIWETKQISSMEDLNMAIGPAPEFQGRWGQSHTVSSGQSQITLWETPRAPWVSLGSLQHADAGISSTQQSHAVGNSRLLPFLAADEVWRYLPSRSFGFTLSDASYLANEALWDDFYFSSLFSRSDYGLSELEVAERFASDPKNNPLANSRLRPCQAQQDADETALAAKLLDYQTSASRLMSEGTFNVNSTSVDAWKAVLSGLSQLHPSIRDASGNIVQTSDAVTAFFSRLRIPAGDKDDRWNGFRLLSPSDVQTLAEEIVEQVKARGPFQSLAEFVNRRLEDSNLGKSGAIQHAIDVSGINITSDPSPAQANFYVSPGALPVAVTSGITGDLTQADILTEIGPNLSVRSDTFRIRAYGDAQNPHTEKIEARVWCEAIVQRMPDFVDPSDEPEKAVTTLVNGVPVPNPGLKELNRKLGRRFRIVSFRWLKEDEV